MYKKKRPQLRSRPITKQMKKSVMRLTHDVIDIFPQSCRKVLVCFVGTPLFQTSRSFH